MNQFNAAIVSACVLCLTASPAAAQLSATYENSQATGPTRCTYTEANFTGNAYADTGPCTGFLALMQDIAYAFTVAWRATSLTSEDCVAESKVFTVVSGGGAFGVGARVRFVETAVSTEIMEGVITAWDSGTLLLTVTIDSVDCTGSAADWTIYSSTNEKTTTSMPVSVANGGTGATTAGVARTNLGAPATSDVLALTGGTLTGDLTISSTGPDLLLDETDTGQEWILRANGSNFSVFDSTGTATPFEIAAGAGDDALHIASGGNVGIGTTSPGASLDVAGAADFAGDITISSTGPDFLFDETDAAQEWILRSNAGDFSLFDSTGTATPFEVEAGADDASLLIESDGDVVASAGLIVPDFYTADPCSGRPEGGIFYNDTSDYMCFCNGAGADVQVHAPAVACF